MEKIDFESQPQHTHTHFRSRIKHMPPVLFAWRNQTSKRELRRTPDQARGPRVHCCIFRQGHLLITTLSLSRSGGEPEKERETVDRVISKVSRAEG